MNEGERYICIKEFRRITIGTIVYIKSIGVGHYANSYAITPEDSQKSRIANYTTIKEYFKEAK